MGLKSGPMRKAIKMVEMASTGLRQEAKLLFRWKAGACAIITSRHAKGLKCVSFVDGKFVD